MSLAVNVLGFGLMGRQVASLLYLAGCNVTVFNRTLVDESTFFRQVKLLKRTIETSQEGTVAFVDSVDCLPNEITIESLVEDLAVKQALYSKVRESNNQPYLTNTSSYAPQEIGEDVQGLHFFNPISLGLIESSFDIHDDSHAGLIQLMDKLRKLPFQVVSVRENRGYIGNYILFHEISSALKLIEKFGYSIEQVGEVYKKLYDGRDIFSIIDLIGLDVVKNILVNLKEEDDSIYLPKSLDKAMSQNIYGRKNKTSIKNFLQ